MKGKFLLHVLLSPIEIWEILMAWNRGIQETRQKLRIGPAGNAGLGNPAINAMWEVIEAKVGNNSIGEMQKEMASRGVLTEIPAPTYGRARGDELHMGIIDENLVREWVPVALRGMIYTDRRGRNMGKDSPICQIPWGDTEYPICACRWHMRFARGVRYKECQRGQLAELQMDTVALQRWILIEENSQRGCEGTRRVNNDRLLKQIDDRWEIYRAEKAGAEKKSLLEYEEWAAIDMGMWKEVRVQNAIGEQEEEEDMARWERWES